MSIEKFSSKTQLSHQIIPYTQINRSVIQKMKDLEAGYIWVYLLSMPPDWVVIKEHLKNHFGIGDDKMKRIFSKLRAHNLIAYEKIKDNKTNKFLQWNIIVLNGSDFIEHIENTNKSNKKASGVISTRVETHTSGKPGTTYKTKYKEDKKTKREGAAPQSKKATAPNSSPLPIPEKHSLSDFSSKDFPFPKDHLDLMATKQVNPSTTFRKFFNHNIEKGKTHFTNAELYKWVVSEVEYASKRTTAKSTPIQNEVRSTVPDWGPGHPTYDSMHSLRN